MTPFLFPHFGQVRASSACSSASARRCSVRISAARTASAAATKIRMPPMALERSGFAATVRLSVSCASIPKEPSFTWIGMASIGCETVATGTMFGIFFILSSSVILEPLCGRRPFPAGDRSRFHDRILIRFSRNMPAFSVFFLLPPNVAMPQEMAARSAAISCRCRLLCWLHVPFSLCPARPTRRTSRPPWSSAHGVRAVPPWRSQEDDRSVSGCQISPIS